MIIEITCDCQTTMQFSDLKEFQGDLKISDNNDIEKLKESIKKYGFSFPIFTWENNIIDGHQRLKAIDALIKEGYELKNGALPVAMIKAKDKKEAAEKLLLINSRYAEIDQGGFDLFISEFSIDLEIISDLLVIPEIDFDFENDQDDNFDANDEWDGMPEFDQSNSGIFRSLIVHFENEDNLTKFLALIGQKISDKAKYIYYPKQIRENKKSITFISDES